MNTEKSTENGSGDTEHDHRVYATRQSSLDLIKEEPETEKPVTAPIVVEMLEMEEDYLKVKEKPPPGINASLVLWYAVMFMMFSIGWVSLNKCPLNRLIPIYLIVTGSLGAAARFLIKREHPWLFNLSLVTVFLYIAWNLIGSYFIFKEYQPSYSRSESPKYCNRVVYLFSFWWLILQYTVSGFFVLLGLCYMLMRNDFKKT